MGCSNSIVYSRVHNDVLSDFIAELKCKKRNGIWNIDLTNIKGRKTNDIVGEIRVLPLSDLLPKEIRSKHDKFMIDILEQNVKSQYWDAFLSGKMQRAVVIQNPVSRRQFNVKMRIIFLKKQWGTFYFSVEFSDISYVTQITNEIGLLTHDLRTMFRSIITITNNLKTCADDERQELFQSLDMISKEGLSLCSKTRSDFEEHEMINVENKVYLSIQEIVNNLRIIYPGKINYLCCSNLCLTDDAVDTLKHIMYNSVKNSIQANSSHVTITISDELGIIKITISDNGIGMSKEQIDNFFTRGIPSQKEQRNMSLRNIEENRGEGMLLSCMKWKTIGGIIRISSLYGTKFEFLMEGKQSSNVALSLANLIALQSLTHKETILIVDDSMINLKMCLMMLCKGCGKKINDHPLPKTFDVHVMDNLLDYNIIFTINGFLALEIYKLVKIKTIITDLEMPVMNGYDFISNVIDLHSRQKIIVNSGASEEAFYQKVKFTKQQYDITFVVKGAGTNNIYDLLFPLELQVVNHSEADTSTFQVI